VPDEDVAAVRGCEDDSPEGAPEGSGEGLSGVPKDLVHAPNGPGGVSLSPVQLYDRYTYGIVSESLMKALEPMKVEQFVPSERDVADGVFRFQITVPVPASYVLIHRWTDEEKTNPGIG
jgi:hypothetical protein